MSFGAGCFLASRRRGVDTTGNDQGDPIGQRRRNRDSERAVSQSANHSNEVVGVAVAAFADRVDRSSADAALVVVERVGDRSRLDGVLYTFGTRW